MSKMCIYEGVAGFSDFMNKKLSVSGLSSKGTHLNVICFQRFSFPSEIIINIMVKKNMEVPQTYTPFLDSTYT